MARYSITFDHLLKNRKISDSYRLIEGWLKVERAKLKQSRPPNLIVAVHGRKLQPMGWKKDARKTIEFDFFQQGFDTRVRVSITPAFGNVNDVMMRQDEARANWGELLAELWIRFGEMHAKEGEEERLNIDWNWRMRNGKIAMGIGTALIVAGIILTIMLVFLAGPASYINIILTGTLTPGILMIINGAMEYRSSKKRIMARRPSWLRSSRSR